MSSQSSSTPAVPPDPSPPIPTPNTVKPKPKRRKRKNDGKEHGNNWAKGKQYAFLDGRLHLYYQACNNETWDSFYEQSVDAWVQQGFALEDIGKTPLPEAIPGQEAAYKRQLRRRAKDVSNLSFLSRQRFFDIALSPYEYGTKIGSRSLRMEDPGTRS